MSNTNAMRQLRGSKHENWPVCDPRAAPPGEYGLKSGENGHLLARANGAIDGPYCSSTWSSVFGRRCEPLAGRGGGFGGGAAPAPAHAARRALLQFEWLSKTRGTQAFGSCSRRLCAGVLGYVRCPREGQEEEQSRCFATTHKPCQMRKKKTSVVHVTRW
jgi:hypothetical protein